MKSDLLEGYFVVTKDNHIFEVKGIVHPPNRIIAYLRYAPAADGDRINTSGLSYKKIYDLKKREVYLAENHPEYLWNDDVNGRIMQSVSKDSVAYCLSPIDYVKELRNRRQHLTSLQKASLSLIEILVNRANLDWSDVGITGSQLLGLETDLSDIDIVVYGETAGRSLYSFLKDNVDSIPDFERYSGTRLDHHVDFRWGRTNPFWDTLREIESKKVLQGLYRSYDMFIRLVRRAFENEASYGDFVFKTEDECVVRCRIIDDDQKIFTPVSYIVSCTNPSTLTRLVSFRGRFTEHVERGMTIEARGEIQNVTDIISKTTEKWLFLGERPDDYIIPL